MDLRCPRKLKEYPDSWCPLAVLRLKMLRNAGRELSEEEESKLPGCPFAISHQLANYCFFKYLRDYLPENNLSDSEIAHALNLSVETVRKIQAQAIEKMRNSSVFKEIIDVYHGDRIIDDRSTDPVH